MIRSFRMSEPVSPKFRHPIINALLWQVLLFIFVLLLLDDFRSARCCGLVMIAYWWSVTWIVFRRRMSPTAGDLGWIRWGFLPLFVFGAIFGGLLL